MRVTCSPEHGAKPRFWHDAFRARLLNQNGIVIDAAGKSAGDRVVRLGEVDKDFPAACENVRLDGVSLVPRKKWRRHALALAF